MGGHRTFKQYLQWVATIEIGVSPTAPKMLQQAYHVQTSRWNIRVEIAAKACILVQASEDDLAQVESFQQDELASIGLTVGLPPIQEDWACRQCQKSF